MTLGSGDLKVPHPVFKSRKVSWEVQYSKIGRRATGPKCISEKENFVSSFVSVAQRGLNEANKSELSDESQNHS